VTDLGELPAWPGEPDSLVVTVDTGERIHYLDWGGPSGAHDLPPLQLVHGLSQTAFSWTPVARRLRNLTRVLVPDLRGHGLSESPRSGYELDSLAYDALTVLVANGFGSDAAGRPAVVAGHGLGAMVAATMAGLQPGSVCGLAVVDAGWEDLGEATGQTPAEFERGLGDPPETLSSMEAFLADRRDFDPTTWDADQERAARATVDEKHAGHVAPVTRGHVVRGCVEAMFSYQPREALVAIDRPLLVAVAGSATADDELARERELALQEVLAERARLGLARATVVRFEGAGHSLMRYRPRELSEALAGLLVDARSGYQRS
jgi:pimeloyl-ACP methyl ester carboxylesterase